MDFVEAVVYGNVNRDGLKCSNHSVKEMEGNTKKVRHVTLALVHQGDRMTDTHDAVCETTRRTDGLLLQHHGGCSGGPKG